MLATVAVGLSLAAHLRFGGLTTYNNSSRNDSVAAEHGLGAASGISQLVLRTPQESQVEVVPINLDAEAATVRSSGFSLGGNLWPSPAMPSSVRETGMSLLRLWIDDGVSGADSPINVSQDEADEWANQTVAAHGGLATYRSFSTDAASSNIELLLGGGGFGAPYLVPGENHVFDPKRIPDVAMMWAAVVHRMAASDCLGKPPAFIELSNEPNGHWNTYVEPAVWAKLACAVRAALDARGLHATGISGPGVSLGSSKAFLEALSSNDSISQCIALISVHTWEDNTPNGPHEMAGMLTKYAALRKQFDPDHSKRWVATEFGSRTNQIAGHTFNHTVGKCYDQQYTQTHLPADAEVLSTEYGTRVAAFTLLHMNAGFDAALYCEEDILTLLGCRCWTSPTDVACAQYLLVGWVQDYGWSPLCFGLRSRNGTATEPLKALTKLFMIPGFELSQMQPVSRSSLTPVPDDDTVLAGALTADNDAAVLWIAHAPSNGLDEFNRTLQISGLRSRACRSFLASL